MRMLCAKNFSKIDPSLSPFILDGESVFFEMESSVNVNHLPGSVFYITEAYNHDELFFLDFQSLFYCRNFPGVKTLVVGDWWPDLHGLSYPHIKETFNCCNIICLNDSIKSDLQSIWSKNARLQ